MSPFPHILYREVCATPKMECLQLAKVVAEQKIDLLLP
jgi:hypothetical protein